MDAFKIVMLVMGAAITVVFPLSLYKTVRRRDKGSIFDSLVSVAGVGLLYSWVFWPNAIRSAPSPVRGPATAVVILWIATQLGFGQWLFRPKAETRQPLE